MKSKNIFGEKPGDDMGMQTNVWGPAGWLFLHSIAQNYPREPLDQQKADYYTFFKQVGNVLPCRYCRESYQKFICEIDTELNMSVMESRETLAKWLYLIHNKVNEKLEKKGPSFENVWKQYESYRSKCTRSPDVVRQVKKGCLDPLKGFRKKCVIQVINVDKNGNKFSFGKQKRNNKRVIKLISIKKSTKSGKKFTATFEVSGKRRTIHFGADGYKDFTMHKDSKRRARYIKRHLKDLKTNDPTRAGYLSMYVLWNKKSLKASISDYRKRISIFNKTGKFPKKIK
jgi:hypothetical protein